MDSVWLLSKDQFTSLFPSEDPIAVLEGVDYETLVSVAQNSPLTPPELTDVRALINNSPLTPAELADMRQMLEYYHAAVLLRG